MFSAHFKTCSICIIHGNKSNEAGKAFLEHWSHYTRFLKAVDSGLCKQRKARNNGFIVIGCRS